MSVTYDESCQYLRQKIKKLPNTNMSYFIIKKLKVSKFGQSDRNFLGRMLKSKNGETVESFLKNLIKQKLQLRALKFWQNL